eukprot:UN25968
MNRYNYINEKVGKVLFHCNSDYPPLCDHWLYTTLFHLIQSPTIENISGNQLHKELAHHFVVYKKIFAFIIHIIAYFRTNTFVFCCLYPAVTNTTFNF